MSIVGVVVAVLIATTGLVIATVFLCFCFRAHCGPATSNQVIFSFLIILQFSKQTLIRNFQLRFELAFIFTVV